MLPPLPIGPGHHRLQSSYSLWFSRKAGGGGGKSAAGAHNFDQNLRLLGRFASCEQFWNLYSHLARPSELGSHSDYHLFKDGIKPMWEVIIVTKVTFEIGPHVVRVYMYTFLLCHRIRQTATGASGLSAYAKALPTAAGRALSLL